MSTSRLHRPSSLRGPARGPAALARLVRVRHPRDVAHWVSRGPRHKAADLGSLRPAARLYLGAVVVAALAAALVALGRTDAPRRT